MEEDSGKCASPKDDSGEHSASANSILQNSSDITPHHTPKMLREEEKLNNLCKLLERLDTTYGKNSCPNSPMKLGSIKENVHLNEKNSSNVSPKKFAKTNIPNSLGKEDSQIKQSPNKSITNEITTETSQEENIPNDIAKEQNLTQEEKQALRKAKKEAKKLGKQGGAKVATTDDTNKIPKDSSPHIPKTEAEHKDVALPKVPQGEKSKAELKRERREKQEMQRAAKEAGKTQQKPKSEATPKQKEPSKEEVVPKKTTAKRKEVGLSERHLPLLEHLSTSKTDPHQKSLTMIHPAIRAVGLSMKVSLFLIIITFLN